MKPFFSASAFAVVFLSLTVGGACGQAGPGPAPADRAKRAEAKASASYHRPGDPLEALHDGVEPASSADSSLPCLTFHPRIGSFEWVQYDFPSPQDIEGCAVYWMSDQAQPGPRTSSADKGMALPEHWKVLYLTEAGDWMPVSDPPPPPELDSWNVCRFRGIRTGALRLAIQQGSVASAALLEWKIIPAGGPVTGTMESPAVLRLDDLIPFSARVGFRDFRVSKYSRTEEQKGMFVVYDGRPCRNFLFCHANSSVSYKVPPGYSRFSAIGIGPTGPAWTNHSWIYEVFADGKSLYRSMPLGSYVDKQVKIDADLPPGTKTLTLVTDGAGDGSLDHAIWLDPVLLMPAMSPKVKARLVQLDSQYRAAASKALGTLRANYLTAVGKDLEAARRDFDADSIAVLEAELKQAADGRPVGAPDAPGVTPGLARLRQIYHDAADAEAGKPGSPLNRLRERYDAALAALAGSSGSVPADAAAVAAERSRLRATWQVRGSARAPEAAAPKEGPAPSTREGPAPDAAAGAESGPTSMAKLRQLAEKVLSLNPRGLWLTVQRQLTPVTSLPLPAGSFDIHEISVGGPPAKALTDADLDLLSASKAARIVRISDASLTRLDGLRPQRGLRILVLNGMPLGDEALEALSGLRDLEELSLGGAGIHGEGLSHLAGCTKLRDLNLWGTPVDDTALAPLGSLRALKRLNLGHTRISSAGLAGLAGLTELAFLGLDGATLVSGTLDRLAGLGNLADLNLNSCRFDRAALTSLGRMAQLQILRLDRVTIDNSPLNDAHLSSLAGLAALREIQVTNTQVTGTGLAALGNLRNLEKIVAGDTTLLTDGGLAVMMKSFPNLTGLSLGGGFTAAGLGSLDQLEKLRELVLSGPELQDAVVTALPALRRLETLELRSPRLTNTVLEAVSRQQKLTRLSLDGTAINDLAVDVLGRMKGLKELYLRGLAFSPASVEKLRKSLPGCQVVQ